MPDSAPLRVFLVEDHPWLLATHARAIDLQPDLEVCGTATTGAAALQTLPPDADVVLVDLRLPDMSGLDVIRAIAARQPAPACLVVSARPAVEAAAPSLEAGAVAYVEKGDGTALFSAIRACRS